MKVLPLRKITWRRAALVLLIAVCLQAILLGLSFFVPADVRVNVLGITYLVTMPLVILGGILWLGERR